MLQKQTLLLLTSVLNSQNSGQMRSPLLIDHLFESVIEIIDTCQNESTQVAPFDLREISYLIDCQYKS